MDLILILYSFEILLIMSVNNTTVSSISSTGSIDSEVCSLPSNEMIQSKVGTRRVALTLKTGRRSKHLVLVGEEAVRREKRRARNREAARKLKEKRQMLEDELNQKLKDLEEQHLNLQKYLRFLQQRKQLLQDTINDLNMDPIDKLLSDKNDHLPLLFEQYCNDFDLLQ